MQQVTLFEMKPIQEKHRNGKPVIPMIYVKQNHLPDPERLKFFYRMKEKDFGLYQKLQEVAPDIIEMYPELKGKVITIKTGELTSCVANWNHFIDTITFSSPKSLTLNHREVGEILGHEVTHAYEDYTHNIPAGEKATDLFELTRLPLKYLTEGSCYLECPQEIFREDPEFVQALANHAVSLRGEGLRQYIRWFESQLAILKYEQNGESIPKQYQRFTYFSAASKLHDSPLPKQSVTEK